MNLLAFFETVYRPRRLPSGRPATVKLYRTYLNVFADWLRRPATTDDLTNDLVAAFLSYYSVGRSPFSVDTARSRLMALWRYARLRGTSPETPDLLPGRLPELNPEAWTLGELERLLAAARNWHPGRVERTAYPTRPSLWWLALILVAYDTGFRRAALLALAWADLSRCSLTARAGNSKTWRDETRNIAPDTLTALAEIQDPERTTIFAFAATDATYYRHFDTLLRLAGLPSGPKDKTQKLRRTSATAVAVAFSPTAAQHHLGHDSLATTERYYLDRTMLPAVNTAAALPRPTGKPTLRIVG
jgi:integrase